MKIYMHVNYLEHVFEIEDIARFCAQAGYDGIELRGWDVTGERSLEEYLQWVGYLAVSHGLELVLGCANAAHDPDAAARDVSLEKFKILIRHAGHMKLKILNVFAGPLQAAGVPYFHFEAHGSAIATEDQWRWAADYFREAADFAAEWGINLCFETHNAYIHDLAAPTVQLISRIDRRNVRANFDWGNIFLNRKNQGLDTELQLLAPYIGYAHVKNMVSFNAMDSRLYRAAPLRDGDINTFTFMRQLLATGYRGPIAVENTLRGDKRHLVGEDLEYMQSIITELRTLRMANENKP